MLDPHRPVERGTRHLKAAFGPPLAERAKLVPPPHRSAQFRTARPLFGGDHLARMGELAPRTMTADKLVAEAHLNMPAPSPSRTDVDSPLLQMLCSLLATFDYEAEADSPGRTSAEHLRS